MKKSVNHLNRITLVALFLMASAISLNAQTKNMEKITTGHAPVNGINMYYEIHGEGAMPLVLIHGGGSTIESTFGNILPLLSAKNKIIAVELQAHGRTSDRDAPESFAQDADDVAALLRYLKVDKADIMGFSNGGSTTMQIAIRHPEVVNKIIVIAGATKRSGFIPGFFEYMPNATIADMPAFLKKDFLKVTPDEAKLQTMFEKDKQRMVTFKDWNDDDLKGIKAPALFMAADKDVITVEHTAEMARLAPGAQLVILPGKHGAFIGEGEANTAKDRILIGVSVTLIDEFLSE
ncbi:alpha/beta hydrolase [Mucilaginibacter sp. BJC16-A38]|uniref:alpha/beta fold hydrolase n=1 Tax=Mucilaginibacter phenanthrenivorans TaxID=1234842 RepID=UPI0021570D6F|nr:alpha/beta hydrolase [Mucilaginibacter phenanthrenivorans]MCR8557632.1 alpha/beta hydrolase [Mucilaginibacter phenanthrenivorans]